MKKPPLSAYLSQPAPGVLTLGGTRMAFVDVGSGFWSLRRQLEALLGESATRAVFQQAGADGGASYAAAQGRADDPQTQRQVFAHCLQAYQAAGFGQFEILTADWPLGRMTVRGRETFEAWMMSRHGQRAHSPVCAYTAGVLVGFVNVVSLRRDIVCIERRCQARGDEWCEFELLPVSQSDRQAVIPFTSNPGYDSDGRLTHFDGMVIDLTEQKEAELALHEMNATLEARVHARTEEIERRRANAESLRDIIRMINSNMPLDEFLQRAVELAARQLGAAACVLHHLDLENQVITQTATYGMEGIFEKRGSRPFSAMKPSGGEGYLQALLARQPIYGNYPPLPERVDEIRRDLSIPEAIKRERIALRQRYAGYVFTPGVTTRAWERGRPALVASARASCPRSREKCEHILRRFVCRAALHSGQTLRRDGVLLRRAARLSR